jgi:enoyl-CoA hydratase
MPKKKQGMPFFKYEDYEHGGYDQIIYEKDVEHNLGRIILNGPEKRNCLSYVRLNEITMAIREMELDDDIKVIIIKGNGPAFCAGYDITPVKPSETNPNARPGGVLIHPDRDKLYFAGYQSTFREVYSVIFDCHKPVIAQIHGWCLAGGTHLAAFCDMRIVADTAQIGYPVSRTWTPGGFQYMPWLCGVTRAKYYMFTGKPINGKTAYDWGWASAVFPADKLEEETEAIASDIALVDTTLIMMTKRSINRQMELMGFKTGMMWSMDLYGLTNFRPEYAQGDEFRKVAQEKGLKEALSWRDKKYDIAYRTSEAASKLKEAKK